MDNPKIQPDKITKPIQLLAVWFAGLVLLVGLLLTGAKTIQEPLWLVPLLAISAVLIIPIFLYFVFLLQTKYRPQMQEDTYYAKYLDSSTNQPIVYDNDERVSLAVIELQNQVMQLTDSNKKYLKNIQDLINSKTTEDSNKLETIEKYVKSSKEKFTKVEKVIKKSIVKILLNKVLPSFLDCKNTLVKNGFENLTEFSPTGNMPPIKFLISVGINVQPQFVIETVKLLRPFGLQIINLITQSTIREMRKNDIVVGSYSYDSNESPNLIIDEFFIEKLEIIKTKSEFHLLFK